MPICPKCYAHYPEGVDRCKVDETELVPDSLLGVDPDLQPGDEVGEYVVEGQLGVGTYGTVHKGSHPLIGKRVAIKVLSRRFSVDPSTVSRFVAEARAVNQISHRNIIDIFSFGQLPDGRHYHIMELLDGEPLSTYLKKRNALSLHEALPVLKGLAGAFDAAHAAGIVHRDLKPENVFLARDDDGERYPKLLDFGIAKLLSDSLPHDHKTATGTTVGTPNYMSPEQCRGPDVDHRADIYAYGVLTYQLLTGKLPFQGSNTVEILMKHMSEHPVAPSEIEPTLPPEVDGIVLWMLEKEPDQRPSKLSMVIEALGEVMAQRPVDLDTLKTASIQARPMGDPSRTLPSGSHPSAGAVSGERSLPISGSNRAVWIGTGLIAVSIVAVLAFKLGGEPEVTDVAPIDPAPQQPDTPPPPPVEKAKQPEAPAVIGIEGAPARTEVLLGDEVVGSAPGSVQIPRNTEPVELTFRASGYLPHTKTIRPDRDQRISVKLKKRRRRPSGKRKQAGEDDFEEAFGP